MPRLLAAAAAAVTLLATASNASPTLTDDPTSLCQLCEWAWDGAQSYMADPANQKALMRLIEDDACGILPAAQAAACKDAAREYVPPAIAALLSFDAKEACGSAGFCSPSVSFSPSTPAARLTAAPVSLLREDGAASQKTQPQLTGVPCPMCRLAVNNVKLQLEDPENQAAVLAKARTVCAAMPPDVSDACNAYVAQTAPKIFAIADDIDPNKLCDILGACPKTPDGAVVEVAQPAATIPRRSSSSPPLVNDASTCDTCKAIIAQAAGAVNDPATQRQVLAYAAKLCGSLRTMADACVSDVESYGPAAFETLREYLVPGTCASVGLCPPGVAVEARRHPGQVLIRPGAVESA